MFSCGLMPETTRSIFSLTTPSRASATLSEGAPSVERAGEPSARISCVHPQRAVHRLDVSRGRPVAVRGEDRHIAQLAHFLRKRQQAGSLDPVIIRYQNMHGKNLCPNCTADIIKLY